MLKYNDTTWNSLGDIQKLSAKDLRAVLRINHEKTSGLKADLVLKVYALLMRNVTPKPNCPISTVSQVIPAKNPADRTDFTVKNVLDELTLADWSADLRNLPDLSFIQLYNFLVVTTKKYRHIVLKGTNFKRLKSYQFFVEGHIKCMQSKEIGSFKYVKAFVLASMKKKRYSTVLQFSLDDDVLKAACTCPAGLGKYGMGKCNHIGAVLFSIEDFTRRGLQKHPEPLSCTSRLSVWVVPRVQTVTPRPIDRLLFRRIRFGKTNIRTTPNIISYDPRAPYQRTRDENDFRKLCSSLQNCLSESSFFLFHDLESNQHKKSKSNQGHESRNYESSNPVMNEISDTDSAFNDLYDISSNEFKDIIDHYFNSHYSNIPANEVENIEKATRGQQKNSVWHNKRKEILTASNFGMICKNKVEPSKKLKAILYSNFTTEATVYGQENESKAVELYLKQEKERLCNDNYQALEVGLLISAKKPFLGASLDRVIVDKLNKVRWGVEVKCPISKHGMQVHEACMKKSFFLQESADGKIYLKRNHNYFYQLQGQLFVSGFEFIDFVVYFGDGIPVFIERIDFDKQFWVDNMYQQLEFFFKKALLPELLTTRAKKNKYFKKDAYKIIKVTFLLLINKVSSCSNLKSLPKQDCLALEFSSVSILLEAPCDPHMHVLLMPRLMHSDEITDITFVNE
ncbi:hypothetical protein AC249_AIPGENE9449 [Exaiptasia diaphana]|nr:hypothetical protein AC249_AIPGENE9449 [Exaiptasia diaphana]